MDKNLVIKEGFPADLQILAESASNLRCAINGIPDIFTGYLDSVALTMYIEEYENMTKLIESYNTLFVKDCQLVSQMVGNIKLYDTTATGKIS